MIADIPSCSWDNPGADPYQGTARAAIERMATIPEPVRAVLIARAERNDYDDVVMIDRDSIRSPKHGYEPGITFMAFGRGSRVCLRVDRSGWSLEHVESAMVFCESGWCVARPSVCNNWSIITRRDPEPAGLLGPAEPGLPAVSLVQPDVPLLAVPGEPGEPLIAGPQVPGTAMPGAAVPPVATPGGPAFIDPIAPAPVADGGLWTALPDGPGWGHPWPVFPPVIAWGPVCITCAAPCVDAPVAAVPEPATWALLLAGLGALAWWGRLVAREGRA